MFRPGQNRRFLFTVIIFLGIGAGSLAMFEATQTYALGKGTKARCANNLRGIGLGLIQYSNENRFFPHMKNLATPNDEKDVSKVYRTLIYFKYIDEPKAFRCPSNKTPYVKPGKAVLNNPKLFRWGSAKPGKNAKKPIFTKVDPGVFQNSQLDYTYLRKKVNSSSARSDTIIAADKALSLLPYKALKCTKCMKSQPEGKFCMYCGKKYPVIVYRYCSKCKKQYDQSMHPKICPTDKTLLKELPKHPGNHSDGFNILYGDGHVDFVKPNEKLEITRLVKALHMGSFGTKTKAKEQKN